MKKEMLKEQMNEFLLHYLNKNHINLNILSKNIEKLKDLIEKYDFNNKDKYLSLSCIFGAFLGDSMGSICEFSRPSKQNHLDIFQFEEGIFAPGEVTDDSEMAMAAAFAYMDSPNLNYDKIQDLLYYYFCIWANSPPKDIGRTMTNALELWKPNQKVLETVFDKTVKDNVYQKNYNSLANGYLMRISTFIVYYYYANNKLIKDTINNFFSENKESNDITNDLFYLYLYILIEYYKNVEITHPNPENGIVSAIFVIMVLTGMIRNNPKDILFIFKKLVLSKKINSYDKKIEFKNVAKDVQNKLYQVLKDVEDNKEITVFNSMGYYLHAFKLCLYFLNKLKSENLKENQNIYYNIISEICDFGGDTDTNSCIVGTLFGPLIGYKNFGDKYFSRLFSFIPNERTEFISSFMVIYVDYLEKKYLQNIEKETKDYNFCTINHLYNFFFEEINI